MPRLWRAVVVGAVATAALSLSACSESSGSGPAATTAPEQATTAPPEPLSRQDLVAKWKPKLSQAITASCPPNPYSAECSTAVAELQQLADELAADAAASGFANLELTAREHAASAQRWNQVCSTSQPGTDERSECVVTVYSDVVFGEESLLAAVHEAAQS